MATNPFAQYGIKEVADVIVYDISTPATPVLVMYFDTLKVSNIEETAETTDARGGKGNPKLISWDYGKEIVLTLTDALLSMRSLNLLTNPDADSTIGVYNYTSAVLIKKAEIITLGAASTFTPKYTPASTVGVFVLEAGTYATYDTTNTHYEITTGASSGDLVRAIYEVETTDNHAYEIVVSPNRFPGTYMFIGDTVIRSTAGVDEGFQFIIPKAKIASTTTFTLEAEGDPSVFDFTINVLKADNGTMMSLVKYDIGTETVSVPSNLTLAT
jgi:hypothetical protein